MPWSTQGYNRYGYVNNNPLVYVDPDGNFWNLVIGALIGGVVNWAVHGAQFNAKGLGYFGVGALAGAVGAGIGGGVSSVIGGGTFGAGFAGSSTAAVAGTSFFNGAMIGASSGFASGLVGGMGNGLVEGQNVGQAFSTGLKSAAIGAVTGGLVEGVVQGVTASLDGRRFFDGARVQDQTLVDQANPYVAQRGQADCVGATGESATNGNVTQEQIRNNIAPGTDRNAVGLGDGTMVHEISRVDGGTALQNANPTQLSSAEAITRMQNGDQIFVNLNGDTRHEVLLNKVVGRTIYKLSGKVINKTLFYAMDPLSSQYTRLNIGFLNGSNFWFRIR